MLESDCKSCGKLIRLTHSSVYWVSDDEEDPRVCRYESTGLDIRHEPTELRETNVDD